MGTDITLFVEKKESGKWKAVDNWQLQAKRYWTVPHHERFYSGRNYRLFAVLADVRNSWDIPPITIDPKGLPNDLSEEVLKFYGWEDLRSHSYLTLQEILDYPWDIQVTFEGIFMLNEDAISYKQTNELPDYWWKTVNELNFDKEDLTKYTALNVNITIKMLCEVFWEQTIPKLQALGEPEDVRIVFGFD